MTPPSPGPSETRPMPVRPGKRRFQPRAQKRIRYYWASMILACVFVLLAVVFPFWLDWVRHTQNSETPIDSIPKEFAVPPPRGESPPPQTGPGALPRDGNSQCRGYVTARCNVLGIRPEACDRILVAAVAAPISGGMEACHAAVDPLLKEAGPANLVMNEPPPTPADAIQAPDVPVPADAPKAASAMPDVPAPKDAGKAAQVEPLPLPGSRLPAEKRAETLARMATLVEELQLASQNYGTLPAAQAARLAELRSLAQSEGSPEIIEVYNNLVKRYQKPALQPGGTVTESPQKEAGTGTGFSADGPTPELGRLRSLASEARKLTGGPAEPAPMHEEPPRSISPSEVPAPPSAYP